jgi:tRNA(Met) C34 N-acetyltransferase TmcA
MSANSSKPNLLDQKQAIHALLKSKQIEEILASLMQTIEELELAIQDPDGLATFIDETFSYDSLADLLQEIVKIYYHDETKLSAYKKDREGLHMKYHDTVRQLFLLPERQ